VQGIVTFSALVVSSRISRSPWLWRICGALIILFFITINITLLTTADRIACVVVLLHPWARACVR